MAADIVAPETDLRDVAGVRAVEPLGPGGLSCAVLGRDDLLAAVSELRERRGYRHLECLTALESPEGGLEMMYVLTRRSDRAQVALRVPLAEDDLSVPTLTGTWEGADWLEREVWDLFGVTFEGHPDPRRLLLEESFVGHPLRKSFPREGEGAPLLLNLEAGIAPEPAPDPVGPALEREELERHVHTGTQPLRSERIVLNMGPQHPSTHGVLHVLLSLEGEKVAAAEPSIGYLHRCTEKLCEGRKYNQCIALLDRSDYVSGFATELAFLLAVEELTGIEVPPKAQYLRVLFSELVRYTSHMVWLSAYGLDLGALAPMFPAFRDRERIVDFFEAITGGRMMFNYFRPGGVKDDIPPGMDADLKALVRTLDHAVDEYEAILSGNEVFLGRTKGLGIITPEMIEGYGVTGPMARASGVDIDLRRDAPYAAYADFDVRVATARHGDSYDRYAMRIAEMREAARLALLALEGMPEGEWVSAGVPRTIKPPVGQAYRSVESPRGELGVFVASDGTAQPWRLKIRSPALSNLQVAPPALVGHRMGDVVAILGTVDVVMGEIDR